MELCNIRYRFMSCFKKNCSQESGQVQKEVKESHTEWTLEEDFLLLSAIASYGPRNWELITDLVNAKLSKGKKAVKECRKRWQNKLDISTTHSIWSKEEEARLILLHMKYKNNWCAIASQFKKRHNDMIKNRFYSIFRRVKNKVRNFDLSYQTEIELCETYYILSVIEEHIDHKVSAKEKQRRRATTFIYKLIDGLDAKLVEDYKAAFTLYSPLKEPLKDSLERILDGSESINQSTEVHAAAEKSHKITLPQPLTYLFKEPLTVEEKASVAKECFSCSTGVCGDALLKVY
eukprot:TRINITY_DN2618_c0_g2_i11.p1 TRINITY_DN2618_c0_g2~~TRINITY_DN2618_c0_g2_i11.p1  ORF type:complete len:290 (+),score=48.32 TRINITY_DN2618_c0_g2_i11:96-965(+)